MDSMIVLLAVAANLFLGLFAVSIWARLLKKPASYRYVSSRAMFFLFTVFTIARVTDLFSTSVLAAPLIALVAALVTISSIAVFRRRSNYHMVVLTNAPRRDKFAILWLLAAPVACFFIALSLFEAFSVQVFLTLVIGNVFVLGFSLAAMVHSRPKGASG